MVKVNAFFHTVLSQILANLHIKQLRYDPLFVIMI